ncbi:preprotein translocase subunit SecE [Streptococcus suis]|nr:preprotein translocase subunit SecE [Streptococcus suis]
MKFIKDTIRILKDTSWPSRKQSWKDFISVVQYTTFFVAIVYLFDLMLSRGIISLIDLF